MSFSKDVFCYIVTTKWTNTVFLHLRKISGWVLEIWINGNVLFSPSDCMLSANTARFVQCFLFIDHHLLVRVLDLINMKSGDPIMYLRQRTCPCKWVTLALQGNVRTSPSEANRGKCGNGFDSLAWITCSFFACPLGEALPTLPLWVKHWISL